MSASHPSLHPACRAVRASVPRRAARVVVLPAALLALSLGLGTTAQAYEPASTGTRPAARSTAPDRATVTEGQVREVAPGGVLTYPSVTSCLTITVRLGDGGLVGAHASLFQVPGELRSDAILPALDAAVGDRPVASVEVRGAVGAWHPSYFTKAIESYGEGEQVPVPSGPDIEGLAREVASELGVPRASVTAEDVPDGDQVVTGGVGPR
ncbi:hypothetical protein GCM10010329_86570 [Streptomyces spiroverticillatus]|uniref:Uncharacterized protein n=1 Tax=Streptomyces finlayi TaxID=67296 RepID=A0A918XAP6_9ACTN|nr:hypothetical protein [Streptomyces finlayi]GHA51461.1 hypothetical protein GCM10010329_86570 [Streptomyces spiroverticillatus]GHD20203.1 hypothetical protein GCM10010334_84460 [Streptomyces finlayi]